jgi:hypothetical protein
MIRALMEVISPPRIISHGETSWLLHPKGIAIWAESGCQAAQAKISDDEKAVLQLSRA